jgi:pyruvate dehydrogenase E2 component (dihydrolipoamide acetyltransferase)
MTQVTLPELGESVEGGTLVAWLVAVGDTVAAGQAIAEVSTDKVDTEVPTPLAGTVTALAIAVGDDVVIGQTLLELDPAAGQEPAAAATSGKAPPAPAAPVAEVTEAASPEAALAAGAPPRAPAASSGEPAAAGQRVSPAVHRLLREHGLDAADVRGSGPEGRILAEDVTSAVASGAPRSGSTAATPAVAGRRSAPVPFVPGRREPLSRVRRIIAERMHASLQTTAQLTSAVEADLTRVMDLRARVRDAARERHGVSLSPLAFIAAATARTLLDHPLLNASIDVDASEVVHHDTVGLGVAVDTPTGLIVPVIRDAQDLDPVELQRRIADVAARARDRRLTPDDLQGGTFTITNTGSRGSLFDTPVLNPPEVGILATPAIEKRPVVISDADGDRIAIRHRTYLCLTYDHRLVDGADAARFLSDLTERLDTDDWGPAVAALAAG